MTLTNAKHERFCIEYVVDHNGTQAAIRAGYSERSARSQASDLLTKPDIKERIAELDSAVAGAVIDEAEDVLRDALATYRAAMTAGQFSAAVSALGLRAKRHRDFSDKQETKHSGRVDLSHLTVDDLKALLDG